MKPERNLNGLNSAQTAPQIMENDTVRLNETLSSPGQKC